MYNDVLYFKKILSFFLTVFEIAFCKRLIIQLLTFTHLPFINTLHLQIAKTKNSFYFLSFLQNHKISHPNYPTRHTKNKDSETEKISKIELQEYA
jgi:hypothetical protein